MARQQLRSLARLNPRPGTSQKRRQRKTKYRDERPQGAHFHVAKFRNRQKRYTKIDKVEYEEQWGQGIRFGSIRKQERRRLHGQVQQGALRPAVRPVERKPLQGGRSPRWRGPVQTPSPNLRCRFAESSTLLRALDTPIRKRGRHARAPERRRQSPRSKNIASNVPLRSDFTAWGH